MAGASIVETGFDGAEPELPGRSRQKLPKPGEVNVARWIAGGRRGVKIIALTVRVPELDQRPANRIAAAVEHAPAEISDNARGDGQVIIQLHEVIVLVERDIVGQRVIGPL